MRASRSAANLRPHSSWAADRITAGLVPSFRAACRSASDGTSRTRRSANVTGAAPGLPGEERADLGSSDGHALGEVNLLIPFGNQVYKADTERGAHQQQVIKGREAAGSRLELPHAASPPRTEAALTESAGAVFLAPAFPVAHALNVPAQQVVNPLDDHPAHDASAGNAPEPSGKDGILTSSVPPLLSHHEPPAGDWRTWVLEGDRRSGKTFSGARWLLTQALAGPGGSRWAVCAPTYERVRNSLECGILHQAAWADVDSYNETRLEVKLRNGAKIMGFSADKPGSVRGYNFAGALFDDADDARHYSFYGDLLFAVRTGENPRLMITAARESGSRLIRELEQKAEAGEDQVYVTYA